MKLIHMYFIDLRTCTYTRSGLGFDKIDLKNRKKNGISKEPDFL